ncbi:2678_t:CDS:2 [Diversispora eburnea]|uniref:2678_t:CDS:1 n=1 Tax=Diversispora eburnea TaxID=1213867 RepID=A0A9N9A3T7_9GLOM|nr:2678_t:CDS:2 [Diversispora eburnea]
MSQEFLESDFNQVATSCKEAMGEKRKKGASESDIKQNHKKHKKKKKNDDDSAIKGDFETEKLPPFEDKSEEKENIIENIECLYCTVMLDIPGAYPCSCKSEVETAETMLLEIFDICLCSCHESSVHEKPLEPEKCVPNPSPGTSSGHVKPNSEENFRINPANEKNEKNEKPPKTLSEPVKPYSKENSNLNHSLCDGDLLKSYDKETFQLNNSSKMKVENQITPTSQFNESKDYGSNIPQNDGSMSTDKRNTQHFNGSKDYGINIPENNGSMSTDKRNTQHFNGSKDYGINIPENNGSMSTGKKTDNKTDGNNEAMKSTNYKRQIRSVALFVTFGRKINFGLETDEYQRLGIQPISRELFPESGIKFVTDAVLNCWVNGWKISLFVVSDNNNLMKGFVKNLRDLFLKRSLKIVVIALTYYSYYSENGFKLAGANAVIFGFNKDALLALLNEETSRVSNSEKDDTVQFYNRGEPYYEFTNFYSAPVMIDNKLWPTTEHYFQASKFCQLELRERIRKLRFPSDAFKLGREYNSLKRKEWEVACSSRNFPQKRLFKEFIMMYALKCKFEQHDKLKYLLLSTGTAKIYEHTERDSYWGDGGINGKGLNRLGEYLEELRAHFMQRECLRMVRESGQPTARWIIPELDLLVSLED